MTLHKLPADVSARDFFSLYQRFMALTGASAWTKRLDKVRGIIGDPFKLAFHGDDYPLERAMLAVRLSLTRRHGLPSPETSELYQLYAFIANCMAVHERLSQPARDILVGRLHDALRSDTGFAPLAFEMMVVGSLARKGCLIGFSDFETPGGFDFLVDSGGLTMEIECKSITEDIGRRVKRAAAHALFAAVRNPVHSALRSLPQGLIVRVMLTESLSRERGVQDRIAAAIVRAVLERSGQEEPGLASVEIISFAMEASPFGPAPRAEVEQSLVEEFVFARTGERNREVMAIYGARSPAVVLVLASSKKDRDIHDWLREARDAVSSQFSRQRPAVLCVHLWGITNEQLLDLADLEVNGLSVGATRILDSAKRPHLASVVFFGRQTAHSLVIDESTISQPGSAYIVHNPAHPARADGRSNLFAAQELPASL